MPSKIDRKILRSGDSKVVGLPPNWLRMNRLKVGDTVALYYGSVVLIVPKNFVFDPEFLSKEFQLLSRQSN